MTHHLVSTSILRDLPPPLSPNKRTLGHYAEGSSPNFICSHVPMEIFLFNETRKKEARKLLKVQVPITEKIRARDPLKVQRKK
jgi:hypothetical protein